MESEIGNKLRANVRSFFVPPDEILFVGERVGLRGPVETDPVLQAEDLPFHIAEPL